MQSIHQSKLVSITYTVDKKLFAAATFEGLRVVTFKTE